MTTSDHPFAASAAAASGTQAPSQARLALDNLLRRELKISDPNDAKAVATALMDRYKATPRAQAIQTEAQGLPLLAAQGTAVMAPAATTSSDAELDQAITDVNRDLEELTTNTLLKDISPELQGWASAIRTLIQEGVNAARFALDVTKRDQAFAMRRSLGDYARMARLLGVLTPSMNGNYRKLAQSLDEAASVLIVRMGEALAQAGFNGGRFLLQAPYAELQARRDSVIQNLRSLLTSFQMDGKVNEWNRGLHSYSGLKRKLEDQGQGDLRALLDENELSRCMDNLIQRAAHGTIDGLRALGSTAKLDLQRFRRLLAIGIQINHPLSPPLTSFLQSLELFTDSFSGTGGFRLLWIARPPLLYYGFYGSGVRADSAAQRLINIASRRASLADALDCLANNNQKPKVQVVLDKVLYDIDRAIDLYAMGSKEFDDAEKRAAAYGFLIDNILKDGEFKESCPVDIESLLKAFRNDLLPIFVFDSEAYNNLLNVISFRDRSQAHEWLDSLVANLQNIQDMKVKLDIKNIIDEFCQDLKQKKIYYRRFIWTIGLINKAYLSNHRNQKDLGIDEKALNAALKCIEPVHAELCNQIQANTEWDNLVSSMAPGCTTLNQVNQLLAAIHETALNNSGSSACPSIRIPLPSTTEQSVNAVPL